MTRPPRLGPRAVRLELGLFAFAPVMILLAIRSRDSWLWVCFALPAALGCLVAIGGMSVVRRANAEPYEFETIDDTGDDILGHVGSFLLPIVVDTSKGTEEIIVTALVLALIVHIHIATGRVHVNPVLYVFGWRIYRAASGGVAYYLFARSDVSEWTQPRLCAPLGSAILIERRQRPRP